jgi:hypothetical protein
MQVWGDTSRIYALGQSKKSIKKMCKFSAYAQTIFIWQELVQHQYTS